MILLYMDLKFCKIIKLDRRKLKNLNFLEKCGYIVLKSMNYHKRFCETFSHTPHNFEEIYQKYKIPFFSTCYSTSEPRDKTKNKPKIEEIWTFFMLYKIFKAYQNR